MHLLQDLKKQGKTIFIVQHELSNIKDTFDWVMMLNIRLVDYGPVKKVFHAENLEATYGKSYVLFDEALKLSRNKAKGLICTKGGHRP